MNVPTQRAVKRSFPATALRVGGVLLLALTLTACEEDDAPTSASIPTQTVACKDYDNNPMEVAPKTVTIHNDSAGQIYPVISTSKNAVNQWMQACLRTTDVISTDFVYKLYVNEGKGIPPNSSVTITLPLYSELSDKKYITWWNGGRVVLADNSERLRDKDDTSLATPNTVTCEAQGTECALTTYSSNVQFPEDVYAQLSEYTFGDSIIPAGQTTRLLKPENVGYNISYVDHVYMPVAIGPKSNPYIGYSGSGQALPDFRNKLQAFLDSDIGGGWPVYNLSQLKLPGGYNIFAQRPGTLPPTDNVPVKPADSTKFPPVLTVLKCINGGCSETEKETLRYGEAVQRMQDLWGTCVDWSGEDISQYVTPGATCPADSDLKDKLAAVQAFFKQSHQDYLAMYSAGKCEGSTPQVPTFGYWNAMMHIYGWVPYNEGCGADANPLADTSIPGWDHAKIQSMYIHDLQYNGSQDAVKANPKLLFNPYVQLIHDDLQMNAYGFSVDDAVGFMSELGSGLVFTVGGLKGLENEKQFSYADGFSVNVGPPDALIGKINKPVIKKYGVCSMNTQDGNLDCQKIDQNVIMPTNSQILGFRVGTVVSYPLKVRFTDLNDNVYTLLVNSKFAACPDSVDVKTCPTNKSTLVDKTACSVVKPNGEKHPKSDDWCTGADPNQQREKQLTKNYVNYPKPVDYL